MAMMLASGEMTTMKVCSYGMKGEAILYRHLLKFGCWVGNCPAILFLIAKKLGLMPESCDPCTFIIIKLICKFGNTEKINWRFWEIKYIPNC